MKQKLTKTEAIVVKFFIKFNIKGLKPYVNKLKRSMVG